MEIKKILIKMPSLNNFIFLSFPFLILLSEEYPKAEIFLIVEEGESDAFLFLPFKVRVFERPRLKKNLIETHHFVANLHDVFNVDLFFDLENTFNSAFMGFNFRAPVRVGFESGWNKHLLTHKFPQRFKEVTESNFEHYSVSLLENFLGKNFSEFKISHPSLESFGSERVDQLFTAPIPSKFILIMLDNFSNVTKEIELWKKFFDSFEQQKFIIWTRHDENIISEIFSKIDLGKNELFMHRGQNPYELSSIFKKIEGVIVNNLWAEALCGYWHISTISFLSDPNVKRVQYGYFRFHPLRILFQENEGAILEYRDENKTFDNMNEVADFIHFNFKL